MSVKKEIAQQLLLLSAKGKSREFFQKYASENFKHHNVYFKGNAESLIKAMEENAFSNPNIIVDIQRIIEEENLVAVHSHIKQNPEDSGAAVIHIFKFENDKIVELWDFGQAVPNEIINENGMF